MVRCLFEGGYLTVCGVYSKAATKCGAVPIRGRLLNVVRCLFEGGY